MGQNIKDKSPTLIRHMEELGYSKTYIRSYKAVINDVARLQQEGKWNSYEDYYMTYFSEYKHPAQKKSKKSIIGLVKQFDENNILCGGPGICSNFLRTNSIDLLSAEFKELIENYLSLDKARGISASTIKTSKSNCIIFLKHLQTLGIFSLKMVEEKHVLDFFYNGETLKYGHSFRKNIKAVFVANATLNPDCGKIISYLPKLKERRHNIQYLTTEETQKIKSALFDLQNGVSFRNRAAVILMVYTGLRGCDIANLKLEDIDWENDIISIIQQKTKTRITLPLRPVVGNALYDYITKERPKCDSHNVFLSETNPARPICSSSISTYATKKVFDAAGVRMKSGRRGSHIFRHLLATTLLENEIPQPVISATLGHTNPTSTEAYLSSDFKHLKTCSLPIDKFPIRKEGFYE